MAETTTITKPEFADQLQPYVSAALAGSQDLYDTQVSAGYQGFGQPQVVGIGDDLSGAIQAQIGGFNPNTDLGGVQGGLAGLTNQLQQQAADMTKAGTAGFDQSIMDSYMNPYQQGVTDVAIRKAREESQRQQMMGDSAAAKAGAFGGNRRFLLEGMRSGDLLQQVGDLQAKGSADAFNTALKQMENQRRRQLTGGTNLSNIGKTRVEGIGKAMEASEQAAGRMRGLQQEQLDDQIREFEAQRDFKGDTLDKFINRIGGSTPKPAGSWGSRQTATPRYSGMEKFSGYASGFGNLLGGIGKFLGFYGGGPVREGFDEEVGQPGGLTALAGPTVRFDNGGGTTEEMLNRRRELQGGFRGSPAFTIDTLRRQRASINRQIDDINSQINNTDTSSRKVAALKKELARLKVEKEKYTGAGITTSREDKITSIEKAAAEKKRVEDAKNQAEKDKDAARKLAASNLRKEQDKAKERQAAKYKAYKDKIDRDNKYAAFFGITEAISQLPLSVKKDAAAIQKISKQKDVMDAEDFAQFGSPEQRKAAKDIAEIDLTKSKKGKAGRVLTAADTKAIMTQHRALIEAWGNDPKNLKKEMSAAVRAKLLNQAARDVALAKINATKMRKLSSYTYSK
jgi:hypothetical protein